MNKSVIIILISIIPLVDCLSQAWIQQNSGTNQSINTVYFCNPDTGFAAGSGGVILKTTNGGLDWNTVAPPVNITFHYIRMFGPDSIVAASKNNDTVLFTVNSGLNWTMREVETFYTSGTNDVCFVSFHTGFYYKAGGVYCTTDAGQTWARRNPGVGVRRMSFVNENTGWVCGLYTLPYPPPYGTNYSEVCVTHNAGVNWTVQMSVQEQSYSIYRIYMKNFSDGFFNDASSFSLQRTQNGGANWSSTSGAGAYQTYYDMSFPSAGTGYFIGYKTIKSTNGGSNWTELSTPHPAQTYTGIFFINDYTGWLTGSGGIIIKTISGGITGVRQSGEICNARFELYQNYPNPFNPVTTIKFNIPEQSDVALKIYDITGRVVETLINGKIEAGYYSIPFRADNISSGVYFYTLDAGKYKETKRMTVIK